MRRSTKIVLGLFVSLFIGFACVAYIYALPEVSNEEQLRDVKKYAEAFEAGEWDGHLIWRMDYHRGRDYYAKAYSTHSGVWTLEVGDYNVTIGATLDDTSTDELIKAYREGRGWIDKQVWSVDYTVEYSEFNGVLSKHDYLTGESDPWFATVGPSVGDDIKYFDVETLSERRRPRTQRMPQEATRVDSASIPSSPTERTALVREKWTERGVVRWTGRWRGAPKD